MTEPIEKKVDQDWKRRAQMEKAQLDAQQRPGRSGARPETESEEESLFISFVSTLATQAAMFLGVEPDPLTGARRMNPEQARFLIDALGMLEEKTRGNLDPEEERHLKMVLQELRLAFVEVTRRARGAVPR
ncbi:MAG: DUF1844 domain-containing protein [Planctomycetes bacterium]|nr:DUF1844 domain-containing protein [Planctomycetota bacterium]